MKDKLLVILATGVLTGPMAAMATPIPSLQTAQCEGSALTCATGITGLDVMGSILDVRFVGGSYDTVFAAADPYFLGDVVGADAAVDAIVLLFNSSGIDGVLEAGPAQNTFLIPTAITSNPTGSCGFNFGAGATWSDGCSWGHAFTDVIEDVGEGAGIESRWAVFEIATPPGTVPEPGSLSLLGLGLLVLARARRDDF